MKKATFFVSIIAMWMLFPYGVVKAELYPFSGFTISLEEKMVNGHQGIQVMKGGINPFETTLSMDGHDLYYNKIVSFQDGFIVYGYTSGGVNPRNYDGFFTWLDANGNILMELEEPLDYDYLEDVKNVYNLNGYLVVELQQTVFDGSQVEILSHIYLIYDEEYALLKEHKIDGQVKRVEIEDRKLLGSFSYSGSYDFAFEVSGDLLSKDDHLGIEDKGVYQGEVCLSLFHTAYLNDEKVNGDTCVDTVGNHLLRVDDKVYSFVIEPLISGVEEKVYYESVMVSFNSGYATLNGDGYSNQEEIVDIGHYTFILYGINGYHKEINFEIGAVVEGITNNTIYQEPVSISFTGQGFINNQYVKSPITVESEGEYILKIKGEDGYLESYYFEIKNNTKENTFMDFVQKVDAFVLGTVLIVGIVVLKRKK